MPIETDSLLPDTIASPEISTTGYPRQQRPQQNAAEINYTGAEPQSSPPPAYTSTAQDYPTYQHFTTEPGQDEQDQEPTSGVADRMARMFRAVFLILFVIAFFALTSSFFNGPSQPLQPKPDAPHGTPRRNIQERVRTILESTPLIDGHDDLAIFLRGAYANNIANRTFRDKFENGGLAHNVDLPRLRKGMNGGAFWSSFVGCPVNATYDMTDANYATSVAHTWEQIDLLKRLQAQYPDDFTRATIGDSSPGPPSSGRLEMLASWRQSKRFFGPISIEGLHQVPPSAPMSTLRAMYNLGVRMATLTWNCHNPFADASIIMNDYHTPPQVVKAPFRSEGALTHRGRAVIHEMNRLGIIVDLSHTSYWTQKAVLTNSTSRAPIVFSHSSAYALCPHPRNVHNDILDLVKSTNSIVMVNFSPDFISCHLNDTHPDDLPIFDPEHNTIHQVARHIKYIGTRIGWAHVGLGSDFDGISTAPPRGLDGVDKFPDLIAELLEMGVGDEQVRGVVGENILRVWRDVDDVAAQMREEGVLPGLDDADGF